VNVPAETVWANVIVVFGNERPVRLSHVAAPAGVAPNMTAAGTIARLMNLTLIRSSYRTGVGVIVAASHQEDNLFLRVQSSDTAR
jgi:hypothetical protein